MEAGASLQYSFWPKSHEQTMKCEQVHHRGAKAMNFFSTNPMFHVQILKKILFLLLFCILCFESTIFNLAIVPTMRQRVDLLFF